MLISTEQLQSLQDNLDEALVPHVDDAIRKAEQTFLQGKTPSESGTVVHLCTGVHGAGKTETIRSLYQTAPERTCSALLDRFTIMENIDGYDDLHNQLISNDDSVEKRAQARAEIEAKFAPFARLIMAHLINTAYANKLNIYCGSTLHTDHAIAVLDQIKQDDNQATLHIFDMPLDASWITVSDRNGADVNAHYIDPELLQQSEHQFSENVADLAPHVDDIRVYWRQFPSSTPVLLAYTQGPHFKGATYGDERRAEIEDMWKHYNARRQPFDNEGGRASVTMTALAACHAQKFACRNGGGQGDAYIHVRGPETMGSPLPKRGW